MREACIGLIKMALCALALSMAFIHSGCGTHGTAEDPDRPIVVVSVPPQAQFVERLAGSHVHVEVMLPPGANPATYEPSLRQMRAMEQARVYVKVGHPAFPFERAWLDQLLAERSDIMVVDCAKNISRIEGDPHIWLSPDRVHSMAEEIAAALQQMLPEYAHDIESNLEQFRAEVERLDHEIHQMLAPHQGKRFLVFHPAWGYFANQYDLQQIAIEHEHKEPSADHVSEVIDLARRENIRVIFVQPQFSKSSAAMIAEHINGNVITIDPLARDWLANMRTVARAFRDAFES